MEPDTLEGVCVSAFCASVVHFTEIDMLDCLRTGTSVQSKILPKICSSKVKKAKKRRFFAQNLDSEQFWADILSETPEQCPKQKSDTEFLPKPAMPILITGSVLTTMHDPVAQNEPGHTRYLIQALC